MKRAEASLLEAGLWKAAAAVMLSYQNAKLLKSKEDKSPLTEADLLSNEILSEALQKMSPEIPLVSEENATIPYSQRKAWKRFWLLDPLDGTKEFIAGIPEFTLNVALIEEGIPTLGFVLNPVTQILYTGEKGAGSYKSTTARGTLQRIFSEKRTASRTALTSRFHASTFSKDYLEKHHISSVVTLGSSLKLTALAEGTADLYPRQSPIHEWDVAAGDAVYRYSGREGERYVPYTYNTETLTFPDFLIGFEKT